MISPLKQLLTLQLLCLLATTAYLASAQEGIELLPNNTMAQLDEKGWPQGWPKGRSAHVKSDGQGVRLICTGADAGVYFRVPLKPEYGRLKLSMQMRVTDVTLGKEDWGTGRLTMSFHNESGERVGPWPNVFGMTGTKEWTPCERIYTIPEGAVVLALSPCNLGASGTVEFKDLSLTVSRMRAMSKADAPLPAGAPLNPWEITDAWCQTTTTRERICLNGLWGFRPVLTNESTTAVPPPGDCWGWFKVPGIWPNSRWEPDSACQQVWLAPWFEEHHTFENVDQVWYKRRLNTPQTWQGRRIVLEFTMLQTHASALIDGKPCGELWYPGGELDLTEYLKPGEEQELALLVTARPLTAQRNAFMAPDRIITDKARVQSKGITGDLYLCAMPTGARLQDAQVTASTSDMHVTFAAECANLPHGEWQLQAEVKSLDSRYNRKFISTTLLPDTNQTVRFSAHWPEAQVWDTDATHNRYTATISLLTAQGEIVDTLTPITFGFREIKIAGRNFMLNGSPIHLRALHNTSSNGEADKANLTAATEMCRRMREYGFNMLISGNYDFTPGSVSYLDGLLEACDAEGVLVAFTLPHIKDFDYKVDDPQIAELYRQQTAWLIRRVRNHPSVIFYAMNHNCTGYYGDQNPLKIDGSYSITEDESVKGAWWARNRRRARITQEIARAIDPSRPIYHHQSGNLGDMHTVNCYLNWAPIQERSDWLEHWSAHGVKPLFFIEWGLPHISSWSSYRGPQFIWRCEAFQSLWAAEYAAQFWGDAAYVDTVEAVKALDHEEALWATGKPFAWYRLNQPLRDLKQNYQAVQALFANDNWRAHRARGVSAMLPWDQGDFWQRIAKTTTIENTNSLANLKQPGIVPDRLYANGQYILDPGAPDNFIPSAVGHAWLRWNQPDCAFIGGPIDNFSAKDHLFTPNARVKKSLIIINDRRREQRVEYTWRLLRQGTTLIEKRGHVKIAPGCQAVVPVEFNFPRRAKDCEAMRLTAIFNFADNVTQVDDLRLHTVMPAQPPKLNAPLQIYDPCGLTLKLLHSLKVPVRSLANGEVPDPNTPLVIGREALDATSAAWLAGATHGQRILVCEQHSEALERILGFRIAERGSRQLFPRFKHPVTAGLESAFFRDWSGAATLLPPFLQDLPQSELHDPRWQWCGFENTRVWRCGNRGSVASVLIEKPARGNWRALLDGEFDMQYSALLECVTGRGTIIFCQLDMAGRTENEPAAARLASNLIAYLASTQEPQAIRDVVVAGDQSRELLRDLGVRVSTTEPATYPEVSSKTLIVTRSGKGAPADLLKKVEQGANILCLGMRHNELNAWYPATPATILTNACFKRIEKLPLELNGLCNGDWAWHGRVTFEALRLDAQECASANPALKVVEYGKGRIVLWQVPPWLIDAAAKPWLRSSKRHANAMAARLLGNLGADFEPPFATLPAKLYLDTPIADDDPYRYYRW